MSPQDFLRILQVIFGIGLVLFVHEAGHFIAARLCSVRVEVFSLGFGPRLFGFKRGATLYQIALIPLGGYVKMAGEFGGRTGDPAASDELQNKSVGQRFFIYSGGVLMNVLFAIVVFPIILAVGVPVLRPVISAPDKGTPAWHARIPGGTEIVAINGEEMFDFYHIPNTIALADAGPAELTLLYPGADVPSKVHLTPIYSKNGGFSQIGVRPAYHPLVQLLVDAEGPAAQAGLRTGDRLLSLAGGRGTESLPDQVVRAFLTGSPLTMEVERDGERIEIHVEPEEVSSERKKLGIGPLRNRIEDLRPNPLIAALGLGIGDRLVEVNSHTIRGPMDLGPALDAGQGQLEVLAERARDGTRVLERLDGPLSSLQLQGFEDDVYLHYDQASTLLAAMPGRAASKAGLHSGDRILSVGGSEVSGWAEVLDKTRAQAATGEPVTIVYERRAADGSWGPGQVEVRAVERLQTFHGFGLQRDVGVFQTLSLGESIRAGAQASWRFLTDAWLTLQKMFLREVSTENLAGIITIGAVSFDFASQGWTKLFFFLCMLSINLAFLNVLPIPVLDGGHLFFCLVEAIKGSPVSERTMGYSQVVGLVMILTIMVYVTYRDVLRVLPGNP